MNSEVGEGPYWAEVYHGGQIEHILDQGLGMVLRRGIKDRHTFRHVCRQKTKDLVNLEDLNALKKQYLKLEG